MTLPLPYPFDREYMQLALAASVLVGGAAPLVGGFLVQKRLSLMGDGIGHVAFAGVAAGLLFSVWPVWTALAAALAASLGIEWFRARGRIGGDLALALFFYSGIAAGVVLIQRAGSLNASALGYLFGSVLTVSRADTITMAVLAVVIVVTVVVTWRAMFAVVFDEQAAVVAGLPVAALNFGLAALTAVTVVAAMRVVGLLLVSALMVLPVGAAQRLVPSFRGTLVTAALLGAASAVVGLAIARIASTAPGGTIALVAAAMFAISSAIPVLSPRTRS
ncbi:MAG: zinc transport system permease protein [Actinomycetota bacterium]|jgi:zinc transport system permease protein